MHKYVVMVILVTMLASCTGDNGKKAQQTTAQIEVPKPGKVFYVKNCAQCHALNDDRTGPALAGVLQRWQNDTAHVMEWIKNSQAVIAKEGDTSYAGKLFKKWYSTTMPAYNNFSDDDIKEVLLYVNKGVE